MSEIWKTVPGFPRYEVSDMGRLRSLYAPRGPRKVPKILSGGKDKDGYILAVLCAGGGKRKTFRLHGLITSVFLGPRPGGHEVAHLNGIRDDNRVANLAYKTSLENSADMVCHDTVMQGERNHNAKLTVGDVLAIRASGKTNKELSEIYGCNDRNISNIRTRRSWKHV